jgi:SAM-dependent methyltransferase
VETTPCLLCGATRAQTLYTLSDALLGLPGSFVLVRCCECGLVYLNPRPTPAEIGAYYPPEYDPFVAPPWAHPRLLPRLARLYGLKKRWALVEQHAPLRPGPRDILDVGCATGVFLAAGSDQWRKAGVELSAAAVAYAREHFGLRVHQGTLDTADLPDHSFDVVTLWDVLEHVHQPLHTLAQVRRLLRPDGILVLRVPSIDAWDARLFGRSWAGLDAPRHMFVPDTATTRQLLERSSFALVARRCLNGSYAMLALNWRFWVRQHVAGEQWQRRARWLDNPLTQIALAPFLWLVDRVYQRCPLPTIVARRGDP